MSSLSRVSIPNTVKKTIQNIKEIAGNHSDDEIYAMLKECSMDPNETTQRLLFQDTFHEVKRKRDKKKENVNTREPADSRWRPGPLGRGGRSGRAIDFPRYNSQDAGGGRNGISAKESGIKQASDEGGILDLPVFQHMESKATSFVASSLPGMANGKANTPNGSSILGPPTQIATGGGANFSMNFNKSRNAPEPRANGKTAPSSGVNISRERPTPNPERIVPQPSVLGVYSSASDPVLVPSIDSRVPGAVGTIKREVRVQRAAVEPNPDIPTETIPFTCQEIADSSQRTITSSSAVENSQLSETSSQGGSISRPSSNYGSRSQQISGPQKAVGPGKEWQPKPTNSNPALPSGEVVTSMVETVTDEAGAESVPVFSESASEDAITPLQKKLEEEKKVIIPDHLHVAESEKNGLSFGSFEAGFSVTTSYVSGHDAEKSSALLTEPPQETEEIAEEPFSSNEKIPEDVEEEESSDDSQSPKDVIENMSPEEASVSSSAVSDNGQPKLETTLPPGGPQFSVVHTVPTYSTFGLMPPIMGTQFAPFDSSDPQARAFVVQQSFDPASYYSQLYRAGTDADGRFSPLLIPAAGTKYNGNIALSSQPGQSPQESGDSLSHSTSSPTPHVSQAAGVMPSSISVTQQPIPVFRQPHGMHMPHFSPNYLPYGSYYSPIFVPPPTIHQFLSNGAFPQQPPSGSVYPPPAAATAAATGIKYSLPQFKVGGNTGNPNHMGMQPGYAQFSSLPAGYSPSPASSTGNSTGNEDLAPQFKENNVYITAPQSEGGSAVWVPAPGREVSGMQAGSFYNLSPQGQHIAFAPSQAGHPAFAGIYHPTQTMGATVHPLLQQPQTMAGTVEMVGPPAGVYQQQPQRTQVNWTNTY